MEKEKLEILDELPLGIRDEKTKLEEAEVAVHLESSGPGDWTLIYEDDMVRTLVSNLKYRSGTVNSKSFVGKVWLQIKWKFKLN